MKKMVLKISIFLLTILFLCLIIFPFVEIDTGSKIIKFSYSSDISEYENNPCYDESYFYNEEKDISVHEFDFYDFLFFHVFVLEYENGNVCDKEFLLEEEYITNFLSNAIIEYNDNNIDLDKLIEGKTAIVGNKKYFTDEEKYSIDYVLDGESQTMFIFYDNDLLVIQVGLSDEGPKFIAYK